MKINKNMLIYIFVYILKSITAQTISLQSIFSSVEYCKDLSKEETRLPAY